MNIPIAIAAALMALTVGVHVFAGGPEVNAPIQASSLPEYLRAISAVLWHAVTVVLALFALALAWLARHPNPALGWLVSAVQVGFAGLFIFYGLTRLDGLWIMPQWITFLLIPALTMWGVWQQARPARPAKARV